MKCKFCHKDFVPKDPIKSHWKRYKFCSKKCANNSKIGKKLPVRTEEWKKNLSNALTGKKASDETRRKQSLAKKGKHWTKEQREKIMSKIRRGEDYPTWKGGYENKLWHNRQRRLRKLGNGGSHTLGEWETLKAQYNWTCPACKRKEPEITLSLDHIVPLSKGGSDNIENIQPLCRSCNSKKQTKTIRY